MLQLGRGKFEVGDIMNFEQIKQAWNQGAWFLS